MDESQIINEQDVLRIADVCPRAMSAYFICVKNADDHGKIKFSRNFISDTLGRSWIKFKNDLRSLLMLGIIYLTDHEDSIDVELYDRCVL